jgi:hypothetical protein
MLLNLFYQFPFDIAFTTAASMYFAFLLDNSGLKRWLN